MIRRSLLPALVALAVALTLTVAPATTAPARAALPDLTLVSNATYQVVPGERRVAVTVDIVARNRLEDTRTRRYYFDRAFLAVPAGTTGFKLTSTTGDSPTVRVSQKRSDYQILALGFGQRIYSQKQASFRLTFNLPDPGGAANRNVRIGQALVSFPVWAYASVDTPGSTVRVIFPEGYDVRLEAGSMPDPTTDDQGRTVYASGKLDDPDAFFAFFVADRPASYRETPLSIPVGANEAHVMVRSWPDDPEWQSRVTSLFEEGLPELGRLVGVPWERTGTLLVEESVSRTTGGYAGLYDPREGRIEVAYYADPFVVLHEAAHIWFNGSLLADRWANEAFASYYAQSAAGHLGQKVTPQALTDELRAVAYPLNAWGRPEDATAESTTEDYGYAASLELARAIARRAGHDGLRRVWEAAAERKAAYQRPAVDPGTTGDTARTATPPDWRGLLDLLEDETGERFDDLWRQWVVRDEEDALLSEREAARGAYQATLRAAGRWELPAAIRDALRAWQFDTATALLDEANALLDRRADLEAAARDAGLRLPARLETAFESDAGFALANDEANAEAAAIEIYAQAAASRPDAPDLLQEVGLIGETPDVELTAARESFATGELEEAAHAAIRAQATWEGAWEVGRNRLMVAAGVALLALLGILFVVSRWRARRRRAAARFREPTSADQARPAGGPAPG